MLSYCGINCEGCPVYLATQEQDKQKQAKMRISVARHSREHYGLNLTAADIDDCCGCASHGKRISAACTNCDVRKCAMNQKLKNCGYCDAFPCEKLNRVFIIDPGAREKLEAVKVRLKGIIH